MNLENVLTTLQIGNELMVQHLVGGRANKAVARATLTQLARLDAGSRVGGQRTQGIRIVVDADLPGTISDIFELSLEFLSKIEATEVGINLSQQPALNGSGNKP